VAGICGRAEAALERSKQRVAKAKRAFKRCGRKAQTLERRGAPSGEFKRAQRQAKKAARTLRRSQSKLVRARSLRKRSC